MYAIGGLGVDERVFSELNPNFELTPLSWIRPASNEPLQDYARRFSIQIDQNEPFSIIGISFGGMLAIELNKILQPKKIILISSASSKSDIPVAFRIFGHAGLLNLIPNFLMKPPFFVTRWLFGVHEPRYQSILRKIIADTDVDFLRWALKGITKWNNVEIPGNMIRIHGSSDRLLGCSKNESAFIIKKAGHFMVMNRSEELSQILNELIGTEK